MHGSTTSIYISDDFLPSNSFMSVPEVVLPFAISRALLLTSRKANLHSHIRPDIAVAGSINRLKHLIVELEE